MTVAPVTTVTVPANTVFYDSDGDPFKYTRPTALGALGAAAEDADFTWEAPATSLGPFVNNIGGFGSLPDYSQGWTYTINGWSPTVGASALLVKNGDQEVWAQDPDNTFARASFDLVATPDATTYTTGQNIVVTVKADDLAKVNSQADYTRFGLKDPSKLQTPDQFPPVAGATLHVGSATYTTDANGQVTVAAPANGDFLIWAEKNMDATAWYVRSAKTLVNVAPVLAMTDTKVSPTSFKPGKQKPKVTCTLSRAASLKLQVRDARNKIVWGATVKKSSGTVSYAWSGKDKNGKYVAGNASYKMWVTAVDSWGRTTSTVKIALKSK